MRIRAFCREPDRSPPLVARAIEPVTGKCDHSCLNRTEKRTLNGCSADASSLSPVALASRPLAPDIVFREVGDGRDTRQPGQVRKEAAVTSAVSGRLPASCSFSEKRKQTDGRDPGTA